MFDWNEQNQAVGALWGAIDENEDHIVPRSKDGNTKTISRDYKKRKRTEDNCGMISTDLSTGSVIDLPPYNLKSQSGFKANRESPGSRTEVDPWPDLPNLSAKLLNGYNNWNDLDSLGRGLMNDLNHAPVLCSGTAVHTVQLRGEPEPVSNELTDKESGAFLDCDWANIEEFEDLDRYFRNDPVSGYEMFDIADGFLPSSADVISTTTQSIPIPDIPLCNDQPSDEGGACSHLDEHYVGQRSLLQKEKMDAQKIFSRSQRKTETDGRNEVSQTINGDLDCNMNQIHYPCENLHTSVTSASDTFPSVPMGHVGSCDHVMYTAYGYPTHIFPEIHPVLAERKEKRPIPADKLYPDPRHSNAMGKASDFLSRPAILTPQEKIEKLRRRQQRQAMLAIQQQQQRYSHQITNTDDSQPHACYLKGQSQDTIKRAVGPGECADNLPESFLEEQNNPELCTMLIDDKSLEETICHEFQDAVKKVDIKVRLCIRDSLYRLARSAIQRQSDDGRDITDTRNQDEDNVIADEDAKYKERPESLPDLEADTNHIDRIVAHLLFHGPESCSVSAKTQSSSL